MDGVLVDVQGHIIELRKKNTPTLSDITEWNMCNIFPEGNGVYHYFNLPYIFSDAKPIEGAIEAYTKLLDAGHEIVLCTVVPFDSHNGLHQKITWAKNHLPNFDHNIIATHRKDLVRGDVIIDDKIENIEMWKKMNPNKPAILFPRPWNKAKDWDNTVKAWGEIVDYLVGYNDPTVKLCGRSYYEE